MTEVVLTFESTHMALWAEEVADEVGVPVQVVPAPPSRNARCDLALVCRPRDRERLSQALTGAGVEFSPPAETVDAD